MFLDFIKRVLKAVKGRLSIKDIDRLKGILDNQGKKYLLFSRAILTAIDNSEEVSERDIKKFANLLKKAERRIETGIKNPFSTKEKKEIEKLFIKAKIGPKVIRIFTSSQIDEILISEVKDTVTNKQSKQKKQDKFGKEVYKKINVENKNKAKLGKINKKKVVKIKTKRTLKSRTKSKISKVKR